MRGNPEAARREVLMASRPLARNRVHLAQSPQYPHDDEIEHDAGDECDQQKLFHLSTPYTNKLSVAWWIRSLNKRLNGRVTWYACGHSGALTEAELAAAEVELKALQRHAFGGIQRPPRLALTREWSGGGRETDQFGEGTLETRAILKFGPTVRSDR